MSIASEILNPKKFMTDDKLLKRLNFEFCQARASSC